MQKRASGKDKNSALDKALRVLEAVADQPQAVGLPDLSARLQMPRQTVHRILMQLEQNCLLVRDRSRDRYSVGPRLSRLALGSLRSENQGAPIRRILQDLVDDVDETCNISVLEGLDLVYLYRIECRWPLRIQVQAGTRVPAYCHAGGKVLLAYLPAKLRHRLLTTAKLRAYTEKTMTRAADIETALETVRKQGYGLNFDEFSIGIGGVGVPILDSAGRALAAVAIQGPTVRLNARKAVQHVPRLQAAAKRLGKLWNVDDYGGDA
ncbi:MAG: IclR family transcriptional regulator [Pseudomonadota bacterium]|nr:IclR family transcriptional regulator [Pseudomonadota bacterium]